MKILMRFLVTWWVMGVLCVGAADITGGYTFTAGEQNVTHTKLNLLGAGTINTSFLSGKDTITSPGSGLFTLLFDSGASIYYKATLANVFYDSSNLISNRTANTTPSTNAYMLLWTDADLLYTKATLDKAFFSHDFLINGRNTTNTSNYSASLLLYDGTGYFKTPRSNLFNGWPALLTLGSGNGIANMTAKAILTNLDMFWVWDSVANSNKSVVATNLLFGYNAMTNATNGDYITIYVGASNVMNRIPLSALKFFATNDIAPSIAGYSTTNYVPFSAGSSNSVSHGLGATPSNVRVTILCNQTDALTGYQAGDEIDLSMFDDSSDGTRAFACYCNATTINITHKSSSATRVLMRGSGAPSVEITSTNKYVWKVRAWP